MVRHRLKGLPDPALCILFVYRPVTLPSEAMSHALNFTTKKARRSETKIQILMMLLNIGVYRQDRHYCIHMPVPMPLILSLQSHGVAKEPHDISKTIAVNNLGIQRSCAELE